MSNLNPELMYEFHAKELSQVDALKQYADHIVKEIKSTTGWDTDIHITIEPTVKDKQLFCVSMNVFGIGQPIVVKKDGKNVMAVLKKVRRAVLRQIHRTNGKKICLRRKQILRDKRLANERGNYEYNWCENF